MRRIKIRFLINDKIEAGYTVTTTKQLREGVRDFKLEGGHGTMVMKEFKLVEKFSFLSYL